MISLMSTGNLQYSQHFYNRPCDLGFILFCFMVAKTVMGGYVCVPLHVYVCICAHKLVLFVSIDNGYHK